MSRLLCKLGFHKWETVIRLGCKIPVGNIFTGNAYKVDGEAIFQQCKCCPMVRAYADTGDQTQEFDVGLMARNALRSKPSLATNEFLVNCSNL